MSIITLISNLGILTNTTTKPPACTPWSLVPILFVIFGTILSIGFYFVGKRLSKAKRATLWCNLFLLINSLLFLASEIYSEIAQAKIYGHYDWTAFPFQFCTMPLYLGFALQFIKKDKIRLPIIYFLTTFCFVSGFIPLILGQTQLTRWPTMYGVARSFIWHIQILAAAFFLIGFYQMGKNWKIESRYFLGSCGVFVAITFIAQLLNLGFHYYGGVNYKAPVDPELGIAIKSVATVNNADPDSASLFYISPFFRSNVVVFSEIWITCGWFISYILYLISFSLGAFGIFGGFFGLRKLGSVSSKLFKKNKVAVSSN